jgi:hypothetical protein
LDCQLREFPDQTEYKSPFEHRVIRFRQVTLHWLKKLRKAVLSPTLVLKKIQSRLATAKTSASADKVKPKPQPLNLQSGDKVHVKSLDEIRATLDENGRTEGCTFIYSEMAKHCDKTYTVHKRINQFFDEATRKFLKPRSMVSLRDVYCEPAWDAGHDYAGCDRSCFVFWKEDWLERVTDE